MLTIIFAAAVAAAAPTQQGVPTNPHAGHTGHNQADHSQHRDMRNDSHDMACCKDKTADCCKGGQGDCCADKAKQAPVAPAADQHNH